MLNAEIVIAEIQAIYPSVPLHVAKQFVDLLNSHLEKLKEEFELVKEVFVDHEPSPTELEQ